MMFNQVHTPECLTGQQLDAYLAQGWFRMGQTIFTTNFAHADDRMLSTIWLRILLNQYVAEDTHVKLFKRNGRFKTVIQPARITEEMEALYAVYRQSLPFAVSESLHHSLFGKGDGSSVYTTYEVTVRDGDTLIACGFFDLGAESAQGIVSFYDPAYKKYSPGKYVIYAKVQYCKELGLTYFYPGYFVPGNPHFDYKLSIGRAALQFLNVSTGEWQSMQTFTDQSIPVHVMQTKLLKLQAQLTHLGLENRVLKYEFFDANLIPDMRNAGLLDFPVFLHCGVLTTEPVNVLVVFDVRDDRYHLLVCAPLWKPDRTNPDTTFYSAYFLKPVQEVYATYHETEMAAILEKIGQRNQLA